jgi:hypothetical protein
MTDEAPAAAKRKPVKPKDLKPAGAKLWRLISDPAKYELRPDELRILEDACREADLIDEIQRQLAGEPFMVTGSQGQDVIHPLIPELRQHRATLTSMLLKLKLPDDEPTVKSEASPRSVGARNAANARWGNSG